MYCLGAIYTNGADVQVTSSSFTSNHANISGGGMLMVDGNASLVYSSFDYNEASEGGAVSVRNIQTVFHLGDSSFNYNRALNHGGT